MERGYGRGKKGGLPPIGSKEEPRDREGQLWREVRVIDQILKTDNLKCIQGLIFTHEVKNRLAEDLLSCISRKHRLISYGFSIWKEGTAPSELVSGSNPEVSFKRKLEQISTSNVGKFDQERTRHFSQLDHQKWRVLTNSTTSHKHYKPISLSQKPEDYPLLQGPPRQPSGLVTPLPLKSTTRPTKKVMTEVAEGLPKREVSLEVVERLLSRVKGRVVTIWLPPKSYPQFYGILVPSVAVTRNQKVKCRIRKYILFKQSISARVFEAILEYLSEMFGLCVERLELIVSRDDFRGYFQKIGCKIQSWEGVDKISISYTRQQFP